jgi:hypothetical protein
MVFLSVGVVPSAYTPHRGVSILVAIRQAGVQDVERR